MPNMWKAVPIQTPNRQARANTHRRETFWMQTMPQTVCCQGHAENTYDCSRGQERTVLLLNIEKAFEQLLKDYELIITLQRPVCLEVYI